MKHYISNLELYKPVTRFITRQNSEDVAALQYGRLHKTVEKTGCGPAAIFNVMKLLGQEQSFVEIIAECESLRLPWLFGIFGTKPFRLGKYFDRHRVSYSLYRNAVDFKAALATGKCAIVCTKNSGKLRDGIHFYTLFTSGGKLKSLNRYYADTPLDASVEEIKNNRFIAGYLFK